MTLRLQRRRFRFALLQPLRTAAGELRERCGWLLRLDDGRGAVGWGEVAPLQQQQFTVCEQALAALPDELPRFVRFARIGACEVVRALATKTGSLRAGEGRRRFAR